MEGDNPVHQIQTASLIFICIDLQIPVREIVSDC